MKVYIDIKALTKNGKLKKHGQLGTNLIFAYDCPLGTPCIEWKITGIKKISKTKKPSLLYRIKAAIRAFKTPI